MNDLELVHLLKSADPMNRATLDLTNLEVRVVAVLTLLVDDEQRSRRGFWRRLNRKWKTLFGVFGAFLLISLGGGGVLVARNLLDEGWRQSINDLKCDVSAENAHLKRTATDSLGTTTEYWTLKSSNSVVDVVIRKSKIDGVAGGTVSCDHKPRPDKTPFVSFSFYALNDKVPHVALYGWIPQTSRGIIEFQDGRNIIITPDSTGYFLQMIDFNALEIVLLKELTIQSIDGKVLQVVDLQVTED